MGRENWKSGRGFNCENFSKTRFNHQFKAIQEILKIHLPQTPVSIKIMLLFFAFPFYFLQNYVCFYIFILSYYRNVWNQTWWFHFISSSPLFFSLTFLTNFFYGFYFCSKSSSFKVVCLFVRFFLDETTKSFLSLCRLLFGFCCCSPASYVF